ncbi:MAG: tRNA pseudouridine(55) synthase TruB, partial [Pseudolabrys sp.]
MTQRDPALDRPHAEEPRQSSQSDGETRPAGAPQGESAAKARKPKQQFRRDKRDVHGWIALDKPVGMTSTHAVSVIRRLFSAKSAGHAGTLDPLASGCLPIAMGEATKTVPFVMDGRKTYTFTVRFGEERDTDDAEGKVIATSDARPTAEAIRALLPQFIGRIEQVPPKFSALKIAGERAYDLARDGEVVELQARPVEIARLDLVEVPDADHAVLEAECGKGTYVRSLARDIGRALGCYGHVSALRREAGGPFSPASRILVEDLEALCHRAAAGEGSLADALMPVETALD